MRLLDRNESVSPVGNIVTKVRMSVGDEALNMLCFMKCYYRSSGICDQDMLLAALQYVGTLLHLASKYRQRHAPSMPSMGFYLLGAKNR